MKEHYRCKDLERQESVRKFVDSHVFCHLTHFIDELLKAEIIDWDEIDGLYSNICQDCGEDYSEHLEEDACHCGGHLEQEPNEILEWHSVSSYLYNRLEEAGEPLLQWGGHYIWGRCTSGQSISIDSVIETIAVKSNGGIV